MKKNLVLLGMMAVGKSTLGKIVAKKQNLEFIDIDQIIEKKNEMTIGEFFEKKGEKSFRLDEEKEVLKSLEKNSCVIALGGGAFINKNIRLNVLQKSISIWLDVNMKTLNKRVKWTKKRPLLNKVDINKKMKDLYSKRKNIYKLANYKITCDNLDRHQIAKKIIELYEKH